MPKSEKMRICEVILLNADFVWHVLKARFLSLLHLFDSFFLPLCIAKIHVSCQHLSCLTYIACHFRNWSIDRIENIHCTLWNYASLIYHLWTFYNGCHFKQINMWTWNAKNNTSEYFLHGFTVIEQLCAWKRGRNTTKQMNKKAQSAFCASSKVMLIVSALLFFLFFLIGISRCCNGSYQFSKCLQH